MPKIYYEQDANPSLLDGRTVAVIGLKVVLTAGVIGLISISTTGPTWQEGAAMISGPPVLIARVTGLITALINGAGRLITGLTAGETR